MDWTPSADELQVRRKVEEQTGQIDADVWDRLFESAFPGVRDGEGGLPSLAQAVTEILAARDGLLADAAKLAGGARGPRPPKRPGRAHEAPAEVETPDWWRAQSLVLDERYRDVQREVWAMFGLDGPIDPASLDQFITGHLAQEEQTVSHALLSYAYRYEDGSKVPVNVAVHSGEPRYLMALRDEDPGYMYQPLFGLSRRSEEIARQTGCEAWQAVDYLLCDLPLEPAWIRIEASGENSVIQLRIGTPQVPHRDVLAAYREAVDYLRKASPALFGGLPRRERRRRPSTEELLAFVARHEHESLGDWEYLWREWHLEHPGSDRYPNWRAIYEAYRRAVGGMKAAKRGGDKA